MCLIVLQFVNQTRASIKTSMELCIYNLLYCRTNKKPKGVTLLSFNEISVLLWCNVQIFDSTLLVNTAEQISVANILWTTWFKSHIIAMNHSSHSSHEGNESVKILREQKWVYYTLCHNIFFLKVRDYI